MLRLDKNNCKEIGLEDYQIFNFYKNNRFKDRLILYFINYVINNQKDMAILKLGTKIVHFIETKNLKISDVLTWRYYKNKRNLEEDDQGSNKRAKIKNKDITNNNNDLIEDNIEGNSDNNNNNLNNYNCSSPLKLKIGNELVSSKNQGDVLPNKKSPLKIRIGNELVSSKNQGDVLPNKKSPLKIRIGNELALSQKPGDRNKNTPYQVDDFFFTCQEQLFRRFLAHLAIEDFTKQYFQLGIFIHLKHL